LGFGFGWFLGNETRRKPVGFCLFAGCRGGLHDFRCVLNHDHPGDAEHEPCVRDCVNCGTCELHGVPNRGCKRCYMYALNDTGGEQ
jgi:hypothetical protein